MADILSQEELDALLGQMKSDDDDDDDSVGDFFETAAKEEIAEEVPESFGEVAETESEDLDWGDYEGELSQNIQMILNIPVKTYVELGRAHMSIGELVNLGQGAVIELSHLATDLIDLTINDKVVAQGEAVVVNENFGFRVIEVDSVRDRIKKL